MREQLKQLGLTDGEAKAYIALLELGSTTVGPLTKQTGISYSKIYEVLQRLCEKGLASYVTLQGTKHFQAAHPDRLPDYLEKKKQAITEQEKQLKNLLPQLAAKLNTRSREEAEVFLGVKGIKAAYHHLFSRVKKGDPESLFLYTHKEEYAEVADRLYMSTRSLYESLPFQARGVCSENYKKSIVVTSKPSSMKFRFTHMPIPANIDVYQDMVLQIVWTPRPVAFLITSQELASSYREYIEAMWKESK